MLLHGLLQLIQQVVYFFSLDIKFTELILENHKCFLKVLIAGVIISGL